MNRCTLSWVFASLLLCQLPLTCYSMAMVARPQAHFHALLNAFLQEREKIAHYGSQVPLDTNLRKYIWTYGFDEDKVNSRTYPFKLNYKMALCTAGALLGASCTYGALRFLLWHKMHSIQRKCNHALHQEYIIEKTVMPQMLP